MIVGPVSAQTGRQAGAELVGSIGGVLLDAAGGVYQFFAAQVAEDTMRALSSKAANPIAAVELMAALVAVLLWAYIFCGPGQSPSTP